MSREVFGCPSWLFMLKDCWRSNSCLHSPLALLQRFLPLNSRFGTKQETCLAVDLSTPDYDSCYIVGQDTEPMCRIMSEAEAPKRCRKAGKTPILVYTSLYYTILVVAFCAIRRVFILTGNPREKLAVTSERIIT